MPPRGEPAIECTPPRSFALAPGSHTGHEKPPCHVGQAVQRSRRPFDTNGPQRSPATLPRGCARTPVAGRSSGLGFVLRSSLPVYPSGYSVACNSVGLPHSGGAAPVSHRSSLLAPNLQAGSATSAYVSNQLVIRLPADTNSCRPRKFLRKGAAVNTCLQPQAHPGSTIFARVRWVGALA